MPIKLAELHFANILLVETEKAVPKVMSEAFIESFDRRFLSLLFFGQK